MRSLNLAKTILQGTMPEGRQRGKQKKRWKDNIQEWTGVSFTELLSATHSQDEWQSHQLYLYNQT